MNSINLWAVFTTGLLAGGLACMAVQGGLLTTALASSMPDKYERKNGLRPFHILFFLIVKLAVYTTLGALLGLAGELLQLSLQVRVGIQVLVAIFMFGTAMNMLEIHPIFRYFVIQPPRFLQRIIRKKSKQAIAHNDLFKFGFLGAFTVLIPCGVTQAMMALAISTANPFMGALIMFVFILGTSPLFFLLGYLTIKLGDVLKVRFNKIAAVIIIALAVYTLNTAIALTGSLWTMENISREAFCIVSYCDDNYIGLWSRVISQPVNEMTIVFGENGYSPNSFAVKAGSRVTLHLKNEGGSGCVQAFTIPALNIQKVVPLKGSDVVTFTAPEKAGKISFMCSMGMYSGIIEVI